MPAARTTKTPSRPSVASMDRRGPMNPGMIWPQFAINTTSPRAVRRHRPRSGNAAEREVASPAAAKTVSAEPVPMLQVRGRGGHHPGVEPKAARDDERLGSRLGPRLAADRRSPRRPAEIDRRGLTNPDESDRRPSPTRDPERCREDVARPRRHDGERDSAPGHRGGCLAHGPVAADGREQAARCGRRRGRLLRPLGSCPRRTRTVRPGLDGRHHRLDDPIAPTTVDEPRRGRVDDD